MHGGRKRRPQRQQMRRPSHLPPRMRRWRHLVPVPMRKSWPKRRKVKLLSSEGREWTYMHTPFCVSVFLSISWFPGPGLGLTTEEP